MIPLVMVLGISINLFLSLMKVNWVNTPAQRGVAILLPLIILIITKVISTNLALALGMIGALSIVRFRNPVKSPFELVVLFSYIAIGISAAVNYRYALTIWLATMLTPIGNLMIAKLFPKQFSDSEEHFSERTLATFQLLPGENKDQVMSVVKSHESMLNSFIESRDLEESNGEIEISFVIDSVDGYSVIEEELRRCAKVTGSALQKY